MYFPSFFLPSHKSNREATILLLPVFASFATIRRHIRTQHTLFICRRYSNAELTPALDVAIVHEGARVPAPQRYRVRDHFRSQFNEGKIIPHLVRVVPSIFRIPQSELPIGIPAPALSGLGGKGGGGGGRERAWIMSYCEPFCTYFK